MSALEVLKKYWNYDTFRPGQAEVVEAIYKGKNTLALFPTGGGKSICFQVPGLMLDGITIVVSPLIALMKDQVETLQKKDIPAIALHSGMGWKEMRLAMDNALKGRYRFLYVSPERLASENFREYLPNLDIRLLVVDEAHCISQWGYDFRPSYLKIADCLEFIPKAKIAAFTASAPPKVEEDILDKLRIRDAFVYMAPFRRPNLHFHNIETENKTGMLLKALMRVRGSGVVFCDTRRETEEIYRFLKEKNISADYYHAGLSSAQRSLKQDRWMRGQTRIMICTNAFGMGVDKPDVRLVFHLSPPLYPEAYYQEAGRAGRDGQDSWCILFYREHDFAGMEEKIYLSFPPPKELERVYNAVCNYFGISAGAGLDNSFDFNILAVAEKYNIPVSSLYHAVSNLELLGFWTLSDGFYSPSRLMFTAEYSEVYDFKLRHPEFEILIDILLRSYGGIFDAFVKINEKQIATRARREEKVITAMLNQLQRASLLEYAPASDQPKILFTQPRSPYPIFSTRELEPLRNVRLQGMRTMQEYVYTEKCRAIFWEAYYGAKPGIECGKCDVCMKRKKLATGKETLNAWTTEIEKILRNRSLTRTELLGLFPVNNAFELREILRWLMDNKKVLVDANQKFYWNG